MALREILSSYWSCFQALLFPQLELETHRGGCRDIERQYSAHRHGARMVLQTLLPYQHHAAVRQATARP